MDPRTLEQTLQTARLHHHAGRLLEAETLYRQILARLPNHAETLHRLGIIAGQTGRIDTALDFIRRALEQKSDWAEANYDLGNALFALRRLDEAETAYRRAVQLKPHYAQAYCNLGVALNELGKSTEAIAAFRSSITIQPDNPTAFINLGNVLRSSGRLTESIAAYHQAIVLKTDVPEVHNNLGVVLKEDGQLDQSIAAFQRAIALRPGFAEAFNNLGVSLQEMARLDEALAAYQRAIALRPGYAEAHYNAGNIFKSRSQLDESVAAYRSAILLRPDFIEADNNLVYALHFHPGYTQQLIADELRRWNHQHADPLKRFIQPHTNDQNPNRRLKIGYVSPDFREHPVGRFLLPLLAHHDKIGFEIFAYSQSSVSDAITGQLRLHIDHWRDIATLSDTQTADLIRQDQIDILIDLTLHMAHNRLRVFARKPAPVQATWLAYCSSTGMGAMDYRLSDPHLDPPGIDESIYTEKTIRLPETYWCYQPSEFAPTINALPASNQTFITFGSLNNFTKVSEPTRSAWIKLLHAVPTAQLLLHAPPGNHRQQLLERMARDGINKNRIRFAEKVPFSGYFHNYHQIDIALDTFPYGGGTTTCDALWMGVPVITLVGETAVGRGGLSILSNLNLPELIARSEEQYVRTATQLASDIPRLSNLRATLRQRMQQSPLMDAPRFANNMEFAYRHMWREWCAIVRHPTA